MSLKKHLKWDTSDFRYTVIMKVHDIYLYIFFVSFNYDRNYLLVCLYEQTNSKCSLNWLCSYCFTSVRSYFRSNRIYYSIVSLFFFYNIIGVRKVWWLNFIIREAILMTISHMYHIIHILLVIITHTTGTVEICGPVPFLCFSSRTPRSVRSYPIVYVTMRR